MLLMVLIAVFIYIYSGFDDRLLVVFGGFKVFQTFSNQSRSPFSGMIPFLVILKGF